MCGISGFYNSDFSSEDRISLIMRMLQSLHHRGPDGMDHLIDGPVTLGHNHLKIIDLSEGSKQPMVSGQFSITFNGEIYNYIELRKLLEQIGYSFLTQSDTEVILIAYKHWGKSCVEHFVGMWAFTIWDNEKQELFCSRDRFGIKPFYYITSGSDFYFASEYKALKLTPAFKNRINIEQANRGLTFGWVAYHDESYFEDIKILPPSHNLSFCKGRISIGKYWDLSGIKKTDCSFEENRFIFASMFQESMKIHLRSDVKLGSCLSGGIDSSSIASSISIIQPETTFKIFNIYYIGGNPSHVDERPFVREVLNKYPGIKAHYFSPTDDDVKEVYDEITYFADVPVNTSSFISHYFLMRMAYQNDVKVMIDGQGADEYLGGYLHSFYPHLAQQMRKGKLIKAAKILRAHIGRQNLSMTATAAIMAKTLLTLLYSSDIIYEHEHSRILKRIISKHGNTHGIKLPGYSNNQFDNFLHNLLFTTSLPMLLHFNDRNSMAFGIESRVPFLDHRLVEFAFSTSDFDKINEHAETKYLLREAMRDILPQAITDRRDKKGFVTPGEIEWLRGPLKHLLEIDYSALYWLDTAKIKSMVDDYKKGDNSNAKLVWNLCSLNRWMAMSA